MQYNKIRSNIEFIRYRHLLITSVVIGFFSAMLAVSLKHITEHYEAVMFEQASGNKILFFILPAAGLSLIYILRQHLFNKKENKGIKEVFDSTATGKNLPSYKIPSHFINGLLTVSSGGSTGVEVSTVVSTAAIGSLAHSKKNFLKKYRTEFICAGITAGITALFGSPFAGLFFACEVISKKATRLLLITNGIAAITAFLFIWLLQEEPLFALNISSWHLYALPWFIVLGMLAGINSVYLTKCVLYFKQLFSGFTPAKRIIAGALTISLLIIFLPQLYGDGYHAIKSSIATANTVTFTLAFAVTTLCIMLLKPVITSVTLSAGGDGGVFAPSLFAGAFLGLFTAVFINTYFNAGVIPLNFMAIGMAAMLSASIHAPFTALFLVCALINNYTLFLPILIVCQVSKYTAKLFCPYNVYTYKKAA